MNSREIRSKLKSGETIHEVCMEYQITFQELIRLMIRLGDENKTKKKVFRRTGQLYVREKGGRYIIYKNRKYFGTYRTLDDAVKIRDWFMTQRWDKRWVDRACKECGVTRCR